MTELKCTCGNKIEEYDRFCENCCNSIFWGSNPVGYYYKIDGEIQYYKYYKVSGA